jgi:hypothetical protein
MEWQQMESLVTAPETSQRLLDAGFPSDARYGWVKTQDGYSLWNHKNAEIWDYPAYFAQEIADQLPYNYHDAQLSMAKDYGSWLARYENTEEVKAAGRGKTMAEALAALWLKLQEAK